MVYKEIERTEYLNKLLKFRDDNRLIKVITGVRRCGKSTLIRQYRRMLMESGVDESETLYMDLESIEYKDITDRDSLDDFLHERVPKKGRFYVFLDEVQDIEGWERTVRSLTVDTEADVYITGSNSDLLSGELATLLTGRFVTLNVMPLSFREYHELRSEGRDSEKTFIEYMEHGGFPLVDASDGPERCEGILQDLMSSILNADVLSRGSIRNPRDLTNMVDYLMQNIGNPISSTGISRHLGISRITAEKYMDLLCNAFLFYKVDRIDLRSAALNPSPKYYSVDSGLRRLSVNFSGQDMGRVLENIVFLELKRRGYRIQAGSWNSKEVDFVIEKPRQCREYVQVCTGEFNEGTRERELAPLRSIKDNFPKTLMVMFGWPTSYTEDGITVRNVRDWLLDG